MNTWLCNHDFSCIDVNLEQNQQKVHGKLHLLFKGEARNVIAKRVGQNIICLTC